MTPETLQTLAHIPNSRARRAELQYRLDRLDRPQRVQLLGLALDDPYPLLRHDVAEALQSELGRGNGTDSLLDVELTRFLEAVAAGKVPPPEVTQALHIPDDLVPRDSMRARITACVALEGSPFPDRTVDVVAGLLHEESADLRYQALIALQRLVPGSQRLHDAVVEALDDTDPEIAVVATQIAVMHGWSDMLPGFLRARARLGGEDRIQVTFSVGQLIDNSDLQPGDLPPEARGDMITECRDALEYEPHTAAAIKTLANLQAREAAPDLVKITRGWFTHPILKVEAAAALVDLEHEEGEKYLGKALASRRKDARGYALRVVGERKLERFFPRLVDVATALDYHADTATLALGDFGGEHARSVLCQIVEAHSDPEVRRLATDALHRLEAPDPDSFDASLDR